MKWSLWILCLHCHTHTHTHKHTHTHTHQAWADNRWQRQTLTVKDAQIKARAEPCVVTAKLISKVQQRAGLHLRFNFFWALCVRWSLFQGLGKPPSYKRRSGFSFFCKTEKKQKERAKPEARIIPLHNVSATMDHPHVMLIIYQQTIFKKATSLKPMKCAQTLKDLF